MTITTLRSSRTILAAVALWLCGPVRTFATDPPAATPFPELVNTEKDPSQALTPSDAARGFRVPDGFVVTVAAAEPAVQNPIAMAWDSQGRLWVAENYTYADRTKKFDLSLRDRVLIFEDTNGDGVFDKRQVFTDDVQMLTGIVLGYGGVWLMTPPQLIFLRIKDDKPSGQPIVMLDGFSPSLDNHHTFANGLKWGPDGWLYGRCGASSPGRLGVPGTPDEKRVPLFGGVWRFRPDLTRLAVKNRPAANVAPGSSPSKSSGVRNPDGGIVEVLCHGTTNPWGMDWNEHGEAFFINTVNGHLWHVIPGAHYRRPHSEDPNPYVYETIDTHADHYHWDTGKDWTDSRKVTGEHDRLGGGHAHSGATIYLGDNWPDSYRGKLMTLNLHGRRVNVDRLEREGSGYAGRHEPDILQSADPWFRGIDLSYGPDGAVYVLDWSDTGECHEQTGVHRTSGRIFRIRFGNQDAQSHLALTRDFDRLKLTSSGANNAAQGLLTLHEHPNEWFVRQARQVLASEYRGTTSPEAVEETMIELRRRIHSESDVVSKLRLLHSLHVLDGGERELDRLDRELLQDPDEHIRAWKLRLLTDFWPLDTVLGQPHPHAISSVPDDVFRELIVACHDPSGLVRLVAASTLQRIPVQRRLELASRLASRAKDADDHNLPLMVWYGILPVAGADPDSLARFARQCQFPVTRRLIARRLAESIDDNPKAIEELLAGAMNPIQKEVISGLSEGLAGRHKVKAPANWQKLQRAVDASDDDPLKSRVRELSVLFGDGRALAEVQRVALDGKADLAARRSALQTLIDHRAPERRRICEQLLTVRYLNTTAVAGLTEFDEPAIGQKLAKSYRSFFPVDRLAVIDALVTRASFADALLDQVAAGQIPRSAVTVLHARQIRSLADDKLTERLSEVWGEIRDTPADRQLLITRWKSQLSADALAQADKSNGRLMFAKACASCHRLYGHGGQIGPDLTGSGRQNLDYVLVNLIDPSAAVGTDYRMSVVTLADGRVLNGIVAARSEKVLTLQTVKERIFLELADVDSVQTSTQSLMPDGLLQPLSDDQVRDLVAYLMATTQAPLVEE